MQYGLDFIAEKQQKEQLDEVIARWAKDLGTYVFESHLTVISDFTASLSEAKQIAEKVQKRLVPFSVELGEVSVSTTRHQCVFVRGKTQTPLMRAFEVARHACRLEGEKILFMPHISLVYGDFSLKKRVEIAGQVELPRKQLEMTGLRLIGERLGVDEWDVVETYPLD